jgi:benzoyl-CoA reductase/2-hydroxyglutaryl-CoA dehydratase subunit BcrC/BadD/HgdB
MTHESAPAEGRCPWSHAFEDFVETSGFDAAIMTTTCDQMRRTAEILAGLKTPIFLLTVPSTISASSMRLYQSELRRLAAFLTSISGVAPSSQAILDGASLSAPRVSQKQGRTPLCLLGSHLPVPFDSFEALLEKHSAYIAIDGMEAGPAFAADLGSLPGGKTVEETISSLGEAYFSQIRDAFARPNSAFYRWLSVQIRRESPKGILLARNCWCDKWAIEGIRIREWAKLPMLELEFTSGDLSLSAISRLEAFMETCRND